MTSASALARAPREEPHHDESSLDWHAINQQVHEPDAVPAFDLQIETLLRIQQQLPITVATVVAMNPTRPDVLGIGEPQRGLGHRELSAVR
jgi:hypothetical protein